MWLSFPDCSEVKRLSGSFAFRNKQADFFLVFLWYCTHAIMWQMLNSWWILHNWAPKRKDNFVIKFFCRWRFQSYMYTHVQFFYFQNNLWFDTDEINKISYCLQWNPGLMVFGITINIRLPSKSHSRMYGVQPLYNDLRYNDIPGLIMRMSLTGRKIFQVITIKSKTLKFIPQNFLYFR